MTHEHATLPTPTKATRERGARNRKAPGDAPVDARAGGGISASRRVFVRHVGYIDMDNSLNAALNALAEANAILGWVRLALEGKSVSDAAESFPLVRLALGCRATADEALATLAGSPRLGAIRNLVAEKAKAELAALKRCVTTCSCGDGIMPDSGASCGVCHSCVESDRDRHWQRYQDALTVLRALNVSDPRTGERGLCVRGSDVLHCVGVLEMDAWKRIRDDVNTKTSARTIEERCSPVP